MKIALAQIASEIGDIAVNINRHARAIEQAAKQNADLVIFPELSLTGYAPELALELAMYLDDPRLEIFRALSVEKQITICIGLPIKTEGKPQIGLVIFEPGQSPNLSAKCYLHEDELPDFSSGSNYHGPIAGQTGIALAICYELSVEEHADQAHQQGTSVYLASAAKTPEGVTNASIRLAEISRQYGMITLLCNCVGICEGQTAGGKSGVLNKEGQLIEQLSEAEEALLLVDTQSLNVSITQL